MKFIKICLTVFFCVVASCAMAQSSCEKLYSNGVKYQKTMTVASQNKAITYFNKAKICFDSQAKKDLCDQQIRTCRKNIAQIKNNDAVDDSTANDDKETIKPESKSPAKAKPEPRKIELTLDCTYLKFKGKGGEFKKAKVTCNYQDWTITEIPEWVNCSRNENNEIVVEVEKNPSNKQERSGVIKISCGNESVSLTIIQEKFKKFGFI